MLLKIRITAWALIAFFLAAYAARYISNELRSTDPAATATPMMPLEGNFRLTTNSGKLFNADNLMDKPTVVFFGFTNCPDVCPTGLAELTELMRLLKDSADRLQVLFVAVDAKRDTQEVVREYLKSFDPRIIGLTGEKADIDNAVKTFKAYYEIVPSSDSDSYSVNHTAGMYLIDQEKRFVGKLDSHESLEVRLTKLRRLLRS